MVFINRNAAGEITAVSREQTEQCSEAVDEQSPELAAYFAAITGGDFYASDLQFIRVIDDLIHLLVRKNVILFTELPAAVQVKITERNRMRERNHNALNLIVDDDSI
jgi:hypothetical protein